MIFELDDCNGEVALLAVMEVLMFMGFGLNLLTFYKLISLVWASKLEINFIHHRLEKVWDRM